MDATLVMTEPLAREISVATIAPVEMAGVILARAVPHRAQIRLLAREVHWVPPSQYAHQSSHALSIRPEGYVHALARAEATSTVPIWFHTHPGLESDPRASSHDHVVDAQIADLFRLRSGTRRSAEHYEFKLVNDVAGAVERLYRRLAQQFQLNFERCIG